ncbi:MAG TPA: hypothetical protein VK524_11690 [Polyangiaceae bacterium]|nr:hypothetical protein [Polyangiaceae bacterium]
MSLLGLALGCSRGPVPCMSPGTCGSGYECLANRCVPLGSEPVAIETLRVVLTPSDIAVVTANGPRPAQGVPGVVRFGSAQDGPTALFLRFAPVRARAQRIDRAFLLLEPMPGAAGGHDDVQVEALHVGSSWDDASLSWSRQPRVGLPKSPGLARSSPPSTLRIDVTELVRHQRERSHADVAIAVKAGGGSGAGAVFATGATRGLGPRLELYVRRAPDATVTP